MASVTAGSGFMRTTALMMLAMVITADIFLILQLPGDKVSNSLVSISRTASIEFYTCF